jgi:hypothetical protein
MNVITEQSSASYVYNSQANAPKSYPELAQEEPVCREESPIKRYLELAREEPPIFSEFRPIKVAPTQPKIKHAPDAA